MCVVGVPSQAIIEAGCSAASTFTMEERAEQLRMMVCSDSGTPVYSGAAYFLYRLYIGIADGMSIARVGVPVLKMAASERRSF